MRLCQLSDDEDEVIVKQLKLKFSVLFVPVDFFFFFTVITDVP